jgi:hypothetical protein
LIDAFNADDAFAKLAAAHDRAPLVPQRDVRMR